MSATRLLVPTLALLPGYRAALERGWSPNTMRPEAARQALAAIDQGAALFVARQTDVKAEGDAVTLPDGSKVPRLPGRSLWIFDEADEFCGAINLRWQQGTTALPPHVLGHAGYSVVPWKQRRGHATAALRALLPFVREVGLPHIQVTTDLDNAPSQKVIERAGGVLLERFAPPPAFGKGMLLRYRIAVTP